MNQKKKQSEKTDAMDKKQKMKFKELCGKVWSNKRLRSVFLAAFAILLSVAVYVVLLNTVLKPEENDELPTVGKHGEEMANGRPFVVDPFDADKLLGIQVENEFGGFHYYRGEDGNYYFENAEAIFYDQTSDWMNNTSQDMSNILESVSMVDSLVNMIRYMLANEEVEGYNKSNLSAYGLEGRGKAAATIRYENENGEEDSKTVFFGNPTISGSGYYVMVEGRDALYVLGDTYITRCIFTDVRAYFLPQVAPSVDNSSYMDVKKLTIKKNGETYISLRELTEEEFSDNGELFTHVFEVPEGYYPSSENLQILLENFTSFIGESVVEYNIAEKMNDLTQADEMYQKFRDYSLMDANKKWNCELYYQYADFDITLYISQKLEVVNDTSTDGEALYVYYIYSPDFDLIAEFNAENLEWLEWDLLTLLDNHSFSASIDLVSSISLSYDNTNAKFTLQDEKENLKVTSSNGVKVDTDNFRQLYKAILFTTMDGYADKPEEAKKILTLDILFRDGKKYHFEFYGMTARKAYYTLNGSGEFYINRDYVKQMISACNGILKGEQVTVDWKN